MGGLNITGILNVAFDLDVDFVNDKEFVGAAGADFFLCDFHSC